MNNPNRHHHIYELCKSHMHSYVLAELADGTKVNGIVIDLDDNHVHLAVPATGGAGLSPTHHPFADERQFGWGYPGYGYGYPHYGYGGYPGHFNRLVLPLAALVALSALPWH